MLFTVISVNFIEAIKQLDYKLISRINGEWHSPFFDFIFPFTREPFFWLPFYFFLILFTTFNFRKNGWLWILFLILNASISDYVSSTLIKGNIMRLRPCRDPFIMDQIRFLVQTCGGNSSFTSSHACNHFAAAMFIFTTFKKVLSKWWALVFVWAAIPSYAQIYVGVHFPFDVISGALVGVLIGYIVASFYNKKIGLNIPEPVRLT